MADVKNVITLGIGSAPGNIRYFVLFGLDVNPISETEVTFTRTWAIQSEGRTWALQTEGRTWAVESEGRTWAIQGDTD
jgi:hypothetical protein